MLVSQNVNRFSLLTGGVLSATLLSTVLTPQPAQAVLFNVYQSGNDVVVSTEGGTLDLTGLTSNPGFVSNTSRVRLGSRDNFGAVIGGSDSARYEGNFSLTRNDGWTNSNDITNFASTSGSGAIYFQIVTTFAVRQINLDLAGISGSTYTNNGFSLTIADRLIGSTVGPTTGLGLTPDSSIVTSWGPNANQQFTMLVAPPTPVPLESDALPVVVSGLFMAGGIWWKRKRNQKALRIEEDE